MLMLYSMMVVLIVGICSSALRGCMLLTFYAMQIPLIIVYLLGFLNYWGAGEKCQQTRPGTLLLAMFIVACVYVAAFGQAMSRVHCDCPAMTDAGEYENECCAGED